MARTNKKNSEILEGVVSALEKTEDKIEEAVDKIKRKAKKVEKKIEKKIIDAAERVGVGNELLVHEKTIEQETSKNAKLAKLLEKAKKLEKTVKEIKPADLKKKLTLEEEEEKETLVPMEDYLKSSIHLGTRVITPDMRPYVYRRRADGLAVFNTSLLDDKIREGSAFLAQFAPEDIILVCKREAGWKAVNLFAKVTGVRAFTKKYLAGILTNIKLERFTEAELMFICDPWLDKNALMDANRVKIPVLSICDTNNFTAGITQVISGNNKSAKSLGMIFYLLTKAYLEQRKIDSPIPSIGQFIEGWTNEPSQPMNEEKNQEGSGKKERN